MSCSTCFTRNQGRGRYQYGRPLETLIRSDDSGDTNRDFGRDATIKQEFTLKAWK